MRVTKKVLTKLVNEALVKIELDFTVQSIEKSRFRPHEYEGGAWHWVARLISNKHTEYGVCDLYCFYPFHNIEKYLNNGQRLFISPQKNGKFFSISDLEINVTL